MGNFLCWVTIQRGGKSINSQCASFCSGLFDTPYVLCLSVTYKYSLLDDYCGIIIGRWGSIFVDFVGYPHPKFFVPSNV